MQCKCKQKCGFVNTLQNLGVSALCNDFISIHIHKSDGLADIKALHYNRNHISLPGYMYLKQKIRK